MKQLSTVFTVFTVCAAALLTGCSSVPLGAPAPSADNVATARAAKLAPSQVGTFALAPGKDPAIDKSLGVRAHSISSPVDDSFAQYLRAVLTAELAAAGLNDPASKTLITGLLLDNTVDPAMGTGTARLAARITVNRDGQKAYERDVAVNASWESSFIGAIAIPAAINEYSGLYRKLVAELLKDDGFKRALAAR